MVPPLPALGKNIKAWAFKLQGNMTWWLASNMKSTNVSSTWDFILALIFTLSWFDQQSIPIVEALNLEDCIKTTMLKTRADFEFF